MMSSVDHYNYVAQHPPTQCQSLRQSHNAVKHYFVQQAIQYLKMPISACDVVDFACGRGGDLGKVQGCKSYVGVDTAQQALHELQRRALEWNMHNIAVLNCDASQASTPTNSAHLTLCNFALHYFCDTQDHATSLLDTIQRTLKPGGMWCGTYENTATTTFGVPYHAQIGDCVNAIEWRVPWNSIVKIAFKKGLAIVYMASFKSIEPQSQPNIIGFIMQKIQLNDKTGLK